MSREYKTYKPLRNSMPDGVEDFILESSVRNKETQKHFVVLGGVNLYILEPLPGHISVLSVIEGVAEKVPAHLVSNIDAIYVGVFAEFEEKQINAMYRDGAIYVSSQQDNAPDMIDDIIHEIAHASEHENSREIYSDNKIQTEFIGKRERLERLLSEYGYLGESEVDFSEIEYSKELDVLLYNTIGYDIVETLTSGLFIKPYAATDIREYYATAFEEYLFGDIDYIKKISPVAFSKVHLVCSGEV